MNIFLPYEKDIERSIKTLDDVRLRKQIIECKTMLNAILQHKKNGEILGYFYHPVTKFYYNNPEFIKYYGYMCCLEYDYRFDKQHIDYPLFIDNNLHNVEYIPYYMEGSITEPNHIRTTVNVSELFQDKLCKKWDNDKLKNREPKWTRRNVPEFYAI